MKAMVYYEYGSPDVLQLADVPQPTPKDNEVLVKVQATGINAADWHLLRGEPFLVRLQIGLSKPTNPILGADVAGVVGAIGKNVTQFKVGDEVFGDLSSGNWGGFAEYVCAPETAFVLKPKNLSFVQAAAVPMAALTALHGLRDKGQIQPGQKVAISGASGGVGTFAVQIAKALGGEVTATCSTGKMELMRSLGADRVIDYTKENFTQNAHRYDLILAANGYLPIGDYQRALTPKGTYVMTGGAMNQMTEAMMWGPWLSLTSGKTLTNLLSLPNQADLVFMKDLIEAGKVKPVMDKTYPLTELPQAVRYVEAGHAKGKVVITLTA